MSEPVQTEIDHDFALIIGGVGELTDAVMDKFFEAGCSDATFSIQHGRVYAEFTRRALSLESAILSAIGDVVRSGVGADVLRIDDCNLVTQADIARRIGRSRQLVNQYIAGLRGPGGFPPPDCSIADRQPLWQWCAVSFWLYENDMLKREKYEEAEVIDAINISLDMAKHRRRNPNLVNNVSKVISACPPCG